jgi:hypothetical protein
VQAGTHGGLFTFDGATGASHSHVHLQGCGGDASQIIMYEEGYVATTHYRRVVMFFDVKGTITNRVTLDDHLMPWTLAVSPLFDGMLVKDSIGSVRVRLLRCSKWYLSLRCAWVETLCRSGKSRIHLG